MLGSLITAPLKAGGSLLWNAVKSGGGRMALGGVGGAAYGYGSSDNDLTENRLRDAAAYGVAGFLGGALLGQRGLNIAGAAARGAFRTTGISKGISGAEVRASARAKAAGGAKRVFYAGASGSGQAAKIVTNPGAMGLGDYARAGWGGAKTGPLGKAARAGMGAANMAMAYPIGAAVLGAGLLGAAGYQSVRSAPRPASQDFDAQYQNRDMAAAYAAKARLQGSTNGLVQAMHRGRH